MGDALFGPQPTDEANSLAKAAHALGHGYAVDGILLRAIAKADAKQELAASDDIHEGADLGELDWVVQRQQQDVGAEPKPLGVGRQALQQAKLREEVEAGCDVVLACPDRIKTERADQADLLHCLGKAAGRILAHRVLRVEIDTEPHGSRPPGMAVVPSKAKSRIAPERAKKGCHSNPEGRGWPGLTHRRSSSAGHSWKPKWGSGLRMPDHIMR